MIIDADTHLIEPPDIFTSRLARKYHEQCPHIQEHTEKESAEFRNYTANCIGDNPAESLYDPVERAKVMDRHGINAAATYPTLGLGNEPVAVHTSKAGSWDAPVTRTTVLRRTEGSP